MSYQPPQAASTLRVFWIIWCCFWALGWLLVGFLTFFLGWLMVPVSLLAILLPVGKSHPPKVVYFPNAPQDPLPPPGPPALPSPPAMGPPAGWYPDPTGQQPQRYWDGSTWR
jgi:hypothetical protein